MASENVLAFTDANFDRDVLQSDIPVLVDFWATWCAPCKAIAPLVDTVADEYAGKIKVGKVNVDENQATPGKYGVRGIPTMILFKNGAVLDQVVGAGEVRALKKRIRYLERMLGKKTMEVEILQEAMEIAREKKLLSRTPLPWEDGSR